MNICCKIRRMEAKTPNKQKPLLIYDGDCDFCQYWVDYWHKLTKDHVSYKPYQAVAEQFPSISKEDFQKAVYYVAEDGSISRAAKASFLTLNHAQGGSYWLKLYRWLPGFAFVSEKIYALIAAYRSFFFTICLLLWGREHEPPRYEIVAWLFVRIFALIALVAFISFGTQALGIIGSQGIVPVTQLINAANTQLGTERYWFIPMLFWINTSDFFIQTICFIGGILSLFLFFNCLPRICLLGIYITYLSLVCAGQVFMTFQWDLFLLETALISFVMIGSLNIGIWLLRWLLFRFMFAGGIVKILSGDPAWRDFSALKYYFFTEPLPTPIAWYTNQLPDFILSTCSFGTLIVELLVPFLIFFPRRVRFFAALIIMLFQSIILLTGNYNWFNILTILLCLVCLDDAAVRHLTPHRIFNFIKNRTKQIKSSTVFLYFAVTFSVLTIFISLVQFKARITGNLSAFSTVVYRAVAPFGIVNMYGPFAVITKQRLEIIIEGSNDGIDWKEYTFKYKPGDIKRPPLWNIPFQPRLDWQMWFAALSPPEQNPWFYSFLQRLLEGSPTVLSLLEANPFPDKPPVYVRALFYDYHFSTSEERKQTGAWWNRDLLNFYVRDVMLK